MVTPSLKGQPQSLLTEDAEKYSAADWRLRFGDEKLPAYRQAESGSFIDRVQSFLRGRFARRRDSQSTYRYHAAPMDDESPPTSPIFPKQSSFRSSTLLGVFKRAILLFPLLVLSGL